MKNDMIRELFQGWSLEPLKEGWSEDEKYLLRKSVTTKTLRISRNKSLEDQKKEYEAISSIPQVKGIIRPLSYGELEKGTTYILYSYETGEDLRPILANMAEGIQYDLGLQAGMKLSSIHSVQDPFSGSKDRAAAYSRKIDVKIEKFYKHQVQFPGLLEAVRYIDSHRSLLDGRPSVLLHGDYHVGNMVVEDHELKVLDFNRYSFGDPYEEFDRMTMNIHSSRTFSKGLLHAYFKGTPPMAFFALWKLYALTNAVGSIPWALENSPESLSFVKEMVASTLEEFLVDEVPVPRWYRAIEDTTHY